LICDLAGLNPLKLTQPNDFAVTTSETLSDSLERHGIELTDEQLALLDKYCQRLWDWNTRLNLTRHTDYEKFVARDLVDSQWLEQFLEPSETVLDVGTGGGAPGIILAILRPDLEIALCDSVAKKARAVAAILDEIGLRIPIHHAAAQDVIKRERFDTLVVRAVAPLPKLLAWFSPHWDRFDRLLILKGPAWVAERAEARERRLLNGLRLSKLAAYPLPGTDSESVVLQIRQQD
jgi:16S rRNA (guanine527-N7)-methyltransferase